MSKVNTDMPPPQVTQNKKDVSVQLPAKHIVHWFRKGLRLHDNPALREGLDGATTFRCVFIIDPWFASSANVGINKWRFLLQCLEDLDRGLRKLNSRLFVVRGQPADALPKLFRKWGTTVLSFEEDPEPFGRIRDHNIRLKCQEVGITVISKVSHTLYKLDNIIELNGGKAPLTYHQFQALIASMPPPPHTEDNITTETLNGAITPITVDHDDKYGVPSLEELGFDIESIKPPAWIGGETEALARLERHLERKAWVASFGHPKITTESLLASNTGLSPYLRFGCLSTRLFYYQLTDLYKKVKQAQPPISLHGQLLWREFFYCAATKNPNFDRMEGNPICVQIPWDKNLDALTKWASGQTGFPWIDAIMTQLRQEGWIHHLARHAVACFLTRGDLWISWEEGMRIFDELLIDADWSVNAGMWMWWSCSSFFQQFFHCYCPVRFGRKADPNGDFIRKYIPSLKDMPTKYIHEPWVAPEETQQEAKCIIGRDYPLPIVNHAEASKVNMERIKLVYAQLAKYKPQATINVPCLQRSNTIQTSPSPTSIIVSVNPLGNSSSQTLDSQIHPLYQHTPNASTESFHKEYKHDSDEMLITQHIPIQQVIIVPQAHYSNYVANNIIAYVNQMPKQCKPEDEEKQKNKTTIQSFENEKKHDNKDFDFKNVAISTIPSNSANEFYQIPLLNQTLYYKPQEAILINYYNHDKQNLYTSNGGHNNLQMIKSQEIKQANDDIKVEQNLTNENHQRDIANKCFNKGDEVAIESAREQKITEQDSVNKEN